MGGHEEQAAAIRRIADTIDAAVVGVGRGAGVVVDSGRVLTNAHNVVDRRVAVRFTDGRTAEGTVAGLDVDGDLAVVEVDTGEAPAVVWAPATPGLGDEVHTLTRTRNGPRITTGRISAVGQAFRGPRGRLVLDAVEHTAPLARGSSGGPVLDAEGLLLGVNTHRRGRGFYLAIPVSDDLRARIDGLGRGEAPSRPRLGIAVAPPHVASRLRSAVGLDDREGLLVRGVAEGSPADRAGVRRGDLIVEAAGQPVGSSDGLFAVLDRLPADASLVLAIVRGSEELTLTVEFGDTGPTEE